MSNPAIGGMTLRNTLKYGSVTANKFQKDGMRNIQMLH